MTIFLGLLALCSPVAAISLSFMLLPSGKRPLSYALGVGFAAATGFYFLRTGLDSDIARHMEYLNLYSTVDLLHCFDAGHYQTLYIWDIWNWLIAKLGNPYLLQASAAFVNYSILTYIVFDASKPSTSLGRTLLYWLIAISAVSPMGLVVGVRSGTSCMVASLAIYRYYAKDSHRLETLGLLLVSILVHHSALLFLLVWSLVPLCRRSPRRVCLFAFVAFLGLGAVSTLLLALFPAGGNPLNSFIHSILTSVVDTAGGDEWSTTHASSLNTRLNAAWSLLLLASLFLSAWKKVPKDMRYAGKFSGVLLSAEMVSAFSAALMLVFPINGGRPLPVAYMLLVPYLLKYDCSTNSSGAKRYDIFDAFLIAAAAGSFLLHAYSLAYGGIEAWTLLSGFLMGCISFLVV